MHVRKFWAAAIAIVLTLAGCGRPTNLPQKAPAVPEGQLPRITVIAGGSESYWNEAKRGGEAAGKKFGAQIVWKVPQGADRETMIMDQKQLVAAACKNSQGVALAPLDSTKLMQSVGDAARSGLAVVVFARDVYTIQNKLCYIHNDDEKTRELKQRNNAMRSIPDYYEMGFQSVKVIMDYRSLRDVPREIKVAPRELVIN